MHRLLEWLDDRTGIRALLHEALFERVPGGARWRYVWGSTLVFAFISQAITGVILWMSYSPSAQTAWESVFYIQHEMYGGWLLRGLHHFMAQAMIVLLVLHLLQVVIDGAYRAPREINFWLGLILMHIVLGLSLTGYLLPWDQKGFWATTVATNLMGLVPGVGEKLQLLIQGGPGYGHHTLTRFFALHAGVLPALLVMVLVLHVAMFRRHGLTAKLPSKKPDGMFWPDQVLKDAVACLAVLAVVMFFVVRGAIFSEHREPGFWGADLGAPADPSVQYSAARPEWYFLFLFQLLKYFPGSSEVIGAILLPGFVLLLLALMPILGQWQLGHRFNIALVCGLVLAACFLTSMAWHADHYGPESAPYLKAVQVAEAEAHRAIELAQSPTRIPTTGAAALLRSDPQVQGAREFAAACAACHGKPSSKDKKGNIVRDGGPKLIDFASRNWIRNLLNKDHITGSDYFGNSKHFEGDMVGFVTDDLQKWSKEEIEDVVIALSAEAKLPAQAALDAKDQQRITRGQALIKNEEKCAQCHKFYEAGSEGEAPDLTGYGSKAWLTEFISNPAHKRFYGENNDRMPAFAPEAPDSPKNQLSAKTLSLLVDYLRGDWYRPDKNK